MKVRFCLLALCLLPGCSRYYHWTRSQFEQVGIGADDRAEIMKFVRYTDRYDGFNTVGHFDALWYSMPVARWHAATIADQFCLSDGIPDQRQQQLEKEQCEQVTFYLLMPDDCPSDTLEPQLISCEMGRARWSATITIDDRCYQPSEIRKVRLAPDLQRLFGIRYDPHYRITYVLTLRRHDAQGRDILAGASEMKLTMRTKLYEVCLVWDRECMMAQPPAPRSPESI